MLKENLIPKTETVYEIKGDEYKISFFEEFMKDYQADENFFSNF